MASSQPLRILHVAFANGLTGSTRYMCDLAARQVKQGHAVGVALRPRRTGEETETYEMLTKGATIVPVLGSPGAFGMARAMARFRPDVIHTHDGRGPRALKYLFWRPAAVGTLHLDYKPRAMGSLDGIICIAPWQRGSLEGYRGQATTVLNWLAELEPVSAERREAVRASLGLKPDAVLVGFVGRLHAVKGADVLIEAFRETAPANAHLAIVGDGAERAALEALAQGDPRITFAGVQLDVQDWYAAFDLFVSPSREEPFGLVTLEAMAAGCPVLATATEGSMILLDGAGDRASLVPPGDATALGAALKAMIGTLSANPHRVAYDLSRFSGDDAVARIEDFYRRVIDIRRSRRPSPSPESRRAPMTREAAALPRKKASHG